MTWLITGGKGQLGLALSRELNRIGIPFISPGSRDLDITQNISLHDFVEQIRPKVIINCAAWTDVDGAETNRLAARRVNSQGAKNLALVAMNFGAKLIQISTDYVFSGEVLTPYGVNSPKNPQTVYGRTKADGEDNILNLYPDGSLILRTAWLYSPWGKNFAKTMTRIALDGKAQVRVVDDQIGQPTSATDLANQIISLVLSKTSTGIFHATNSGEASWFDFAIEIFKLIGEDTNRVIPISSREFLQRANRPAYSVLSHDSWLNNSIKPMRDWRHALADTMPEIVSATKQLH